MSERSYVPGAVYGHNVTSDPVWARFREMSQLLIHTATPYHEALNDTSELPEAPVTVTDRIWTPSDHDKFEEVPLGYRVTSWVNDDTGRPLVEILQHGNWQDGWQTEIQTVRIMFKNGKAYAAAPFDPQLRQLMNQVSEQLKVARINRRMVDGVAILRGALA